MNPYHESPSSQNSNTSHEETAKAPPRASGFDNFCEHYGPGDCPPSLLNTFDTLIKRPGEISFAILESPKSGVRTFLLVIFLLSSLAYGVIMGSFSGGWQFASSPLKLTTGWIFSALICLPSLHIFSSLSGGRQSFINSAELLLQSMTLNTIILVGFAPVAWIFSQTTNSVLFMGTLHLIIWLIGAKFGLSLLRNSLLAFNGRIGFLTLWSAIFILVALQMSTTLRPLIGEYEPLRLGDKLFFLQHWFSN